MRNEKVYSTKNIFSLIIIFITVFWLLFSLASYWHKSSKIQAEIDVIRITNEKKVAQIEEKKKDLEYLKTPQRIDKEAKMQMGKRQPNEKVLVFVEKQLNVISSPTEKIIKKRKLQTTSKIPVIEKWKWLFWGEEKKRVNIPCPASLEHRVFK